MLVNGFQQYSGMNAVKPQIGDVVRMKLGPDDTAGFNAFSTSTVTDIKPHPQFPEHIEVHLARPHVRVSKIGSTSGTPFVAMEQYTVPLEMFRERYEAFTTGPRGEVDNRRMD